MTVMDERILPAILLIDKAAYKKENESRIYFSFMNRLSFVCQTRTGLVRLFWGDDTPAEIFSLEESSSIPLFSAEAVEDILSSIELSTERVEQSIKRPCPSCR